MEILLRAHTHIFPFLQKKVITLTNQTPLVKKINILGVLKVDASLVIKLICNKTQINSLLHFKSNLLSKTVISK